MLQRRPAEGPRRRAWPARRYPCHVGEGLPRAAPRQSSSSMASTSGLIGAASKPRLSINATREASALPVQSLPLHTEDSAGARASLGCQFVVFGGFCWACSVISAAWRDTSCIWSAMADRRRRWATSTSRATVRVLGEPDAISGGGVLTVHLVVAAPRTEGTGRWRTRGQSILAKSTTPRIERSSRTMAFGSRHPPVMTAPRWSVAPLAVAASTG